MAEKDDGTCYTKKALEESMRKGWMMGAKARREYEYAPARQPRLSSYGTSAFPRYMYPAVPLVGSGMSRRVREPFFDAPAPRRRADIRGLGVLEDLMDKIEDEMDSQEEKAERNCVDGEETARYRYQALNDLLADAELAYANAQVDSSDLPKVIQSIKNKLERVKYGRFTRQRGPVTEATLWQ